MESGTETLDEPELDGNTLAVYWFMIRESKPYSAREIQRRVGLSSSSLARHHISKLMSLGLVGTDDFGAYIVISRKNSGLLNLYTGSGRFFMPRFVLYASVVTGFLLSFLLLLPSFLNTGGIILLIANAIICIVLWIESIRIWRLQPV